MKYLLRLQSAGPAEFSLLGSIHSDKRNLILTMNKTESFVKINCTLKRFAVMNMFNNFFLSLSYSWTISNPPLIRYIQIIEHTNRKTTRQTGMDDQWYWLDTADLDATDIEFVSSRHVCHSCHRHRVSSSIVSSSKRPSSSSCLKKEAYNRKRFYSIKLSSMLILKKKKTRTNWFK